MNTFLKNLLLPAAALLLPLALHAQAGYPEKPVRIVVPYAPGGTTDYAARQIAQKLTEQTKQSFFVENKTGASGTIGTRLVTSLRMAGHQVDTPGREDICRPNCSRKRASCSSRTFPTRALATRCWE